MMTKRIVSLLLAVMMIVAVIPAGIISISAEDTTYTDVELTPDSWLCETYPDSKKSKEPMITEDGTNFYYPDPRVPGDSRGAEIGSSDEGFITSVDDYIFAAGFKFTFDANVCRAGCASWGGTLFSISFGTDVNFEVSIKEGYKLTVNDKTYTKNPKVACTNSWEYTPTNETEAKKINGTYTVEYMGGKVTVKLNGEAIDFGQDILIDAKNFAAGKIELYKGWTWTKVAKDSYDPADYATDFLIFSNVTLSLSGEHIHNYEEYVSNNDATCTANGTKTAKCTVEGCKETDTVVIPDSALGHSFKENGNGTKTCSVCEKTMADVELTPDSWLCETDSTSSKSTYPMITEDGENFYYQAPRGDEKSASNSEIGSSDEGYITSVNDYNFADGFEFTFDANVCRAGCKSWGVTLFSISFGTDVNFEVDIDTGYNLTVNGKTYTKNPNVACSSNYAPSDETEANKINGTYTVEYMDGKLTVKLNGEAIDFGQDILIDAKNFAAGKIELYKGWTWTKVAKDSYDPADYATDFLIFSNVTLSLSGEHIHNYEEYVSNNDATCTANGTKTAKCTVEGCKETDTVVIPDSALGHSFKENGNGTKTCSVCEKTIVAVEITPDSWIIADGKGNTSKPTVSTADGTTFITKEFQNANEGADANEPAIITSRAKYDLSNGFVFSFDADLCRQNTNTWAGDGTNTTTISFGDAVTLEINGTGYSLIVDGTRHKFGITVGNPSNYAPTSSEQVARLNTNYIVEFKDGKVSLYVGALVDNTNTTGLALSEIEVTGDLSAATIRIFRGWSLCTDTKTYASLKNLNLEITAAPTPVAPTPVAPVYEGVQDAKVGDVLSVRFVGTVKDLNYSKVGFKITAMDGDEDKSWTKETNTVYSSLIGNTDTGVKIYDKTNLHGQYIYALTIQGVPTTGTVTFNVTAYGIVDGKEVTDTTFAVTYTDGLYVKTVVIA